MKKSRIIIKVILIFLLITCVNLDAQEGLLPLFEQEHNSLSLSRPAKPGNPFNKAGRKFILLADEGGSFEAWAYPLKLFRNFELSFLTRGSTRPIPGKEIVRFINVSPESTVLTFTYQSFTVKAVYLTPIDEPGALLLLNVETDEPMTIICGFLPVLQPMWPAGIGGQFAYWNSDLKAYIISEPTGKNHGMIGSPAASGISYTPAHMLSENPNEFKIEILDPRKVKNKYIPIGMAGGPGKRQDITDVYKRLLANPQEYYAKNLSHYQGLKKNTLQVSTPNRSLDLAFQWAKITFDNLMVENANLGKGLVAGLGASGTSGRPGFGWFFGGDTYINCLSIMSYGDFKAVHEALAFTRKWQRDDGKMAHELSQADGYVDWWKDYHYGYIHGDTTPYYIVAMYEYAKWSGDTDFIRESWDSLKKAYNWCLTTDTNQDGLMDNKKAGLGALEYGTLTGIETDIYLGAVWVKAIDAMQQISAITGNDDYSIKTAEHYMKAKEMFEKKFWDNQNQFYAYAFNSQGEQVKEFSPWNAVGIMWELGNPEHSRLALEKLCSSELTTDWGIRSISRNSQYFQPLNYNYGAVWPFLSGWVTTALFKHHMPQQGLTLLFCTAAQTFNHNLGCITEVFSGTHNVWPQEAVSQQGFSSAGVVLPYVRGLLGLEGNALIKSISFAPHLPAHWDCVNISNFKVGQAEFDLEYRRKPNLIQVKIIGRDCDDYTIYFAPALGWGSRINKLTLNNNPIDFKSIEKNQILQPETKFELMENEAFIDLEFSPSLEILPIIPETQVGDSNNGIKIIRIDSHEKVTVIQVEGKQGREYELDLMNFDVIEAVKGAYLKNNKLRFTIPGSSSDNFYPHTIEITKKIP